MPLSRRAIHLAQRPAGVPFSDGVLVGDTLYLAGRIGVDPATGYPPKKLEDEIKFLLDGIENVLREAGMEMDDLVSVQIFSPDLTLWEPFNAEYRKRFRKEFPARAFIGSGPLLRGGHFEITGIAVKSQEEK